MRLGTLLRRVTPVATPVAEPVAIQSAAADGLDAEYVKLAKQLGISGPEKALAERTRADEFAAFISEAGILAYPRERVRAYLNAQYGGTPWGWRAVREKDNPMVVGRRALGSYVAGDGTIDNGYEAWNKRNDILIGGPDTALYAKPIPMPVLLTMKRIEEKFPQATFWISDEAKRLPIPKDPFLMVRFGGLALIVERWDEPRFRG
jgi:hypothetical protein